MALVFRDTFTAGADQKLDAHTPDTGTSWTVVTQSDPTHDMKVTAATDIVENDGGGLSGNALYSADATYPSANYEVAVTLAGATLESGDDPYIVCARIADSSNMYGAEWNSTDAKLWKKTTAGGTVQIGSTFTFPASGGQLALSDRCSLIVNGTTVELRINGVVIITTTDSDISAAGKAGLGMGSIFTAGEDMSSQAYDLFTVHSIVTGASTETLNPNAAGDLNQLEHDDGTAGDANNYTEVDESGVDDGNTSYVRTPAGGFAARADFYNLPATAIGGSDTISKVTVTARVARGAAWATPDACAPALKTDATEFRGIEREPAATTYETMTQVFYHNPFDGNVWDSTDIGALQIGVALAGSNLGADDQRCTQVYVEVNYDASAPVAGTAGASAVFFD